MGVHELDHGGREIRAGGAQMAPGVQSPTSVVAGAGDGAVPTRSRDGGERGELIGRSSWASTSEAGTVVDRSAAPQRFLSISSHRRTNPSHARVPRRSSRRRAAARRHDRNAMIEIPQPPSSFAGSRSRSGRRPGRSTPSAVSTWRSPRARSWRYSARTARASRRRRRAARPHEGGLGHRRHLRATAGQAMRRGTGRCDAPDRIAPSRPHRSRARHGDRVALPRSRSTSTRCSSWSASPVAPNGGRRSSPAVRRSACASRLALVTNPELLVLDEPTAAMDVEGRHAFWATMREFAAQGKGPAGSCSRTRRRPSSPRRSAPSPRAGWPSIRHWRPRRSRTARAR